MSSWTLEVDKVLFHSEHPLESLDQEDRGMKSHTRSVVRNRHIPQGEMDLSLEREAAWETGKNSPCQLSRYSVLFSTSRHSSSFSCASPPFINLGMRFLLSGRVVTPHVMFSPNYLY
jgi:hypothetical protein